MGMLSKITIKNFKSLEDISIDFGLITVFIGANGTGKSSVLQALMLLKQSLGTQNLVLDGKYLSLGNFDDIVYLNDPDKKVIIKIDGTSHITEVLYRNYIDHLVNFSYEAVFGANSKLEKHWGYIDGRKAGEIQRFSITGRWDIYGPSEVEPSKIDFWGLEVSFQRDVFIGRPIVITSISSTTEEVSKYSRVLRDTFNEFLLAIEKALKNVFMVSGLRGVDKYALELLSEPVTDFITSDGPTVQASNLSSTLGYNPELSDKISQWTERLFGSKVRQRLAFKKRTSLEAIKPNLSTNIVNEGLGLNQTAFSFAQLAIAPRNSLIAIEEPELHLHPKAQNELMDIFVEIARKEKKKILLTTHSEHVLFRLLINVAKGVLQPEDLSIYFFEKENASTIVKKLRIDEKGRIEGSLPGFFEEEMNEFKDYIDALKR